MKIRAIKGFAGVDFSFYGGEIKEVSEALGKSLIQDGLAEEIAEPKKEKPAKKK